MTEPRAITNIAEILVRPATALGERPALIVDDGPVSYRQLRDESLRWAATLASRGTAAGDHVALVDWGGLRAVAATLGAAHLGAATAHINPLLTPGERDQLVALAQCRVEVIGSDGLSAPDRPDAEAPAPTLGGNTDSLVLFTSGTTGLPKPVPISHASVLARVRAYRAAFEPDRPPNTTIMCVPSFHVGGLLGLILNLWSGDTTVVQPRFEAGRWLELVERHGVTSAFLVPTMIARILDHPRFNRTDLTRLTSIAYGAAAAPTELIRRAMEALPEVAFANVFGQTETLGAYTTLGPADHHDPLRVGSVGRPLAGVEIRIVDPATEAEVANGDVGELWVRSPQSVTEGWLHTGDLGRCDADGYLYPAGRLSETINRGGEKFGPVEVAEAVRTHPAVADVAVAGIPDAEMGERVGVAVVVRADHDKPTLDELRAHCRDRLATYKLPEVVVLVDWLPYNELGKLGRKAAAEIIAGAHKGPQR